jgi:hypothetical protein
MFRSQLFISLLASSAVVLAATNPAVASSKSDRAREAIAAAEAKIHTAETLGAGVEAPAATAQARANLAIAREDLKSGDKDESITAAIRASAQADTAIGELQQRNNTAQAATQQQAADANARAAAAEQSAARSAADANAARNAAAAAQAPAEVDTTVTTDQPSSTHSSKSRVTRRTTTVNPAPSDQVTTSTSVTQH